MECEASSVMFKVWSVKRTAWRVGWKVQSGVQIVECEMQSVKCRVRGVKCKVRSVKCKL